MKIQNAGLTIDLYHSFQEVIWHYIFRNDITEISCLNDFKPLLRTNISLANWKESFLLVVANSRSENTKCFISRRRSILRRFKGRFWEVCLIRKIINLASKEKIFNSFWQFPLRKSLRTITNKTIALHDMSVKTCVELNAFHACKPERNLGKSSHRTWYINHCILVSDMNNWYVTLTPFCRATITHFLSYNNHSLNNQSKCAVTHKTTSLVFVDLISDSTSD